MDMKRISDSYLYMKADSENSLFKYMVGSHVVNKEDPSFNDIVYDVKKRAMSPILVKVLLSNKVDLLIDTANGGVSRAFKVIYAKDIKNKDKNKKKVYIDCTGIITFENGYYKCNKILILLSYLLTAMTYILYYNVPKTFTTNFAFLKNGCDAFVDLMLYIFGYLKVPTTYQGNKEKMAFVIAEYFLTSVVGLDVQDAMVFNTAQKVSGIKEKRLCDYYHTRFSNLFEKCNIDEFINEFKLVFVDNDDNNRTLLNKSQLTTDAFVQKWMWAYGQGTFLGLECFVPFATILTDCYTGSYINNQDTIEKIAGSKTVTSFCNELLKIGSENA